MTDKKDQSPDQPNFWEKLKEAIRPPTEEELKEAEQAQPETHQTTQTVRERASETLGPKKDFLLDPIINFLVTAFVRPSEDYEKGIMRTKEEEDILWAKKNFWRTFLRRMNFQANPLEAVRSLQRLVLFAQAFHLSEMHASHEPDAASKIRRYYQEKGIGNIKRLNNHELITDVREEHPSTLEKTVMEAVSFLPQPKAYMIEDYINANDLTLEDLLLYVYEINNCEKKPENREDLMLGVQRMLLRFDEELKDNPKLKALLEEIRKRTIEQYKTDMRKKKNPLNQKRREAAIQAMEEQFDEVADEARETLDDLYQLKSLQGRAAFRLLDVKAEEREARTVDVEFAQNFGLDMKKAAAELVEKYKKALGKNPEVAAKVERIRQANPEQPPQKVLRFLMNEVLGKKIANALGLDLDHVSKIMAKMTEGWINALSAGLAEGAHINSSAELIESLALRKDISGGGDYNKIAHVIAGIFEEINNDYPYFANALHAFVESHQAPEEGLRKQVFEAAKAVESRNPKYANLIKTFNQLCHFQLEHYRAPTAEKDDKKAQEKRDKFDELKKIVSRSMMDTEEGFLRDYLYNVPMEDTTSINFVRLNPGDKFSFNKLLLMYADSLKGKKVIGNLEEEIERDIFEPIYTELGLAIRTDTYEETDPNYLSEEDFNRAKELKEALEELDGMNVTLRSEFRGKEEVELEENKEDDEEKDKEPEEPENALSKELRKRNTELVDEFDRLLGEESQKKKGSDADETPEAKKIKNRFK